MKTLFTSLLCLSLLVACNKKESDTIMHLSGNVKGLKKGTLYIQKIVDTTLVTIDTVNIDGDAHFKTDLEVKSPEMYYLVLNRGISKSLDTDLPFFAEAGNITIETSLDYFLSDAKITGSKNQSKWEEFKKITSRFNDQNLTLMAMKVKAFQNKKQSTMDSIEKIQDGIMKKRYLYTCNFALNNKDYEAAPYVVLSEIADVNLKLMDTIQKSMTPKVAQSLYGKKLIKWYNQRKKAEQ